MISIAQPKVCNVAVSDWHIAYLGRSSADHTVVQLCVNIHLVLDFRGQFPVCFLQQQGETSVAIRSIIVEVKAA